VKPGGPLKRYTALTSPTSLPRSNLAANRGGHHKPVKRPRNTGPTPSVLRILARRSESLCEFWQCLTEAAHTHHRRPRRMGGSTAVDTNLASNLLRLCPPHHDWIESSRLKALELGLLLHAGADPLRAPVLLRYGTVLLGNDGSWVEINNSDHAEEAK
jgi:hypothetical protein